MPQRRQCCLTDVGVVIMTMRYSCDIVDKSETFVKKEDKKVNEEDEEVVQK